MIPTIGVFVGMYVITRMLSFLTRKGERSEGVLVKIFAVLTIFVTLLGIFDLVMRSTTK